MHTHAHTRAHTRARAHTTQIRCMFFYVTLVPCQTVLPQKVGAPWVWCAHRAGSTHAATHANTRYVQLASDSMDGSHVRPILVLIRAARLVRFLQLRKAFRDVMATMSYLLPRMGRFVVALSVVHVTFSRCRPLASRSHCADGT